MGDEWTTNQLVAHWPRGSPGAMSPGACDLDGAVPWGGKDGGGYACPTALHLPLQQKLGADACDTPSTHDSGTTRELPDPTSGFQSPGIPAYGTSGRISPDQVPESPGSPFLPRPLLPPPGGVEGDGSAAVGAAPRDGDPGRSAWRRAVTAAAGHAGGQRVDVVDVLGAPVRPDVQYSPEVGEYVPRRAFPGGLPAAAMGTGGTPSPLESPAGDTTLDGGGGAEVLGLMEAVGAAGAAAAVAAAAARRSETEGAAIAASSHDGGPGRSAWRRAVTLGASRAGGHRVDVADVLGAPVRPDVAYTSEQGEYMPRSPFTIAGGMPLTGSLRPLSQPSPSDCGLPQPPLGPPRAGDPGRSVWRRAVVTAAGNVGGQGADVAEVLGSSQRQGGGSLSGGPESPRATSHLGDEPAAISPPDTPETISYPTTAFAAAATAAAAAAAARGKWGQAPGQQSQGSAEVTAGAVGPAASPRDRPLSAGRRAWGSMGSPKDTRASGAGGADAAEASGLGGPEPSRTRRTLAGTGSMTAKSRMGRENSLGAMAGGPAAAPSSPLQRARSTFAASPGRSSYSGAFTSGGVPDASGSTGGMGAGSVGPSSPRGMTRLRAALAGRSSQSSSGVIPMATSPAAAGPTRLAWDTGASGPRPDAATAAGSPTSSSKSGAHEAQGGTLFAPRAARPAAPSPVPASVTALHAAADSADRRPVTTGHSTMDSKPFALFRLGSAKGRAASGQGDSMQDAPSVLKRTTTWLRGQHQAAASTLSGDSSRSRTLQEAQSPRGLRGQGSDEEVITWRDNLLAQEAEEAGATGSVAGSSSLPGVR